jgi:hypothetical protein
VTGCVAHNVAMASLALVDRGGAKVHESAQDVGAAFAREEWLGSVDGGGDVVGLGEEVTMASSRHQGSVTPCVKV